MASIRTIEPSIPQDLAERVASRSFRQKASWDICIVSWLWPKHTWVAVALALLILSGVFVLPSKTRGNDLHTEYESLWKRSTAGYVLQTEDDFVRWIESGRGMR